MKSNEVHFSVCAYDEKSTDAKKFREGAFPYEMRFKDYFLDRPDENTVEIDWETQECESDHGLAQFKAEAERWAKENGLIGSGLTVRFKLSTRGGVDWKTEFEIK